MVRAGEGGYLIKDFAKGFVAVGYQELGDMSGITDLEPIRKKYLTAYPQAKPGEIGNQVAMFYKFRTVFKVNEKVITYDPNKREYLVGTIVSDYYYKPGEVQDYPHVRKVKWEGTVSRDHLSASSRNSLGSTLCIFSINEDVWSDIQSALKGKTEVASEESIEEEKKELQQIKEDTIGKARELIKDKILKLDDREMEQLVAAILRAMGYKSRVTPIGPDRGVDVLASPDGLGLEQPRIRCEVKHRPKTQIGAQDTRSFLGGLREGNRGLYVSTGGFSKEAKYEAERSNVPCTLIDLDELASLVIDNYEKFDIEGCTLIPLVKVFWPAE
ncbi:MAG: restriction endonuclease [Geobacter sp.]|nr:restriction endonuclease [Geobacter sp.]